MGHFAAAKRSVHSSFLLGALTTYSVNVMGLSLIESGGNTWLRMIEIAARLQQKPAALSNYFAMTISNVNSSYHSEKMMNESKEFDIDLQLLVVGDNDIPPASAFSGVVARVLIEIKDEWNACKNIVDDSMEKDWSRSTQVEKRTAFEKLEKSVLQLIAKGGNVVDNYVTSASAESSEPAIALLPYAAKQLTYINILSASLVAFSFGVDKSSQVRDMMSRFDTGHKLLLHGNRVQNIIAMVDVCKLYEMKKVTYLWNDLKSIYRQILDGDDMDTMVTTASQFRERGIFEGKEILKNLYAVEKLIIKDNHDCDPTVGIQLSSWSKYLNLAGKQRMLSQKAVRLALNVKAGVIVAQSKVSLVTTLDAANSNLDSLIYGSKAAGIPSPPSQIVASALRAAQMIWNDIEPDIRNAVSGVLENSVLRSISRDSETLLKKLNEAAADFVTSARAAMPTLQATVIDTSGGQRMLMQKMSKEAMLAYLEIDREDNLRRMEETADSWRLRHKTLLFGGVPKSNTSSGIEKTTNVCILQQMRSALNMYQILKTRAFAYANDGANGEELDTLNNQAFNEMNKAVGMYGTMGNISCISQNMSANQIRNILFEVGNFQMLFEKVQKEYLFKLATVGSSISNLRASVDLLLYGSTNISAAPSQEIADRLLTLQSSLAHLDASLNRSSAVVTVDALRSTKGNITADDIEELVALYVNLQQQDTTVNEKVPVKMIARASLQRMLIERMAKEAMLAAASDESSRRLQSDGLTSSIELYEKTNAELLRESHDGMKEVLAKMSDAQEAWTKYEEELLTVARGATSKTALVRLQQRLDVISAIWKDLETLYAIVVPEIQKARTRNVVLVQILVPVILIFLPTTAGVIKGFL